MPGNRITRGGLENSRRNRDWSAAQDVTTRDLTVQQLFQAWREGDRAAEDRVFELLYPALRQIAVRERSIEFDGSTLQATELIHEFYLRMSHGQIPDYKDRRHFLAIATLVMRRVLIDRARRRLSLKRHSGALPSITKNLGSSPDPDLRLLSLDEALMELAEVDPQGSEIVELRFFAGLSLEQTAEALAIGRATVVRRWRAARAWLRGSIRSRGFGTW